MTRVEAFEQLINRINDPVNRSLRNDYETNPNDVNKGHIIEMTIKHIINCLADLKENPNDDFTKNSCDAELRRLKRLLDDNGWK